MSQTISIIDYDPAWPQTFARETRRIGAILGPQALRIEHTGSTSVPGLAAKPVIDIVLVVADSSIEDAYVPLLESAGYPLRIREPEWHQHRMFKGPDADINLHVFSLRCPEIDRMLLFRDWLRANDRDRDRYQRTKIELARNHWDSVQDYADTKTRVIEEIIGRALK